MKLDSNSKVLATISGDTVNISGDTIIAKTSGEVVNISGQSVSISGNYIWLTASESIYVYTSGNYVSISGTVFTSISGNIVKTSGDWHVAKISGDTIIQASGAYVSAIISGTVVAKTSGDVSKISGETIISRVSGEVVRIVAGRSLIDAQDLSDVTLGSGYVLPTYHGSGQKILPVILMGYDATTNANAYRALQVNAAGELMIETGGETIVSKVSGEVVKISGETVSTSVSGNILLVRDDGYLDVRSLLSGIVIAKVSGEMVNLASGDQVIANVSGSPVTVSGNIINARVSGTVTVSVSGNVLYNRLMLGDSELAITPDDLNNTAALSGVVLKSYVDSGFGIASTVIMGYDNGTNANAYRAAAMDSSGRLEVSVVSAPISYSLVRKAGVLSVTDLSGGVQLSSGSINSVTMKAISRNSGDIYVSGSGTNVYPYSGEGFLLEPGESVSLDIDNFFDVYVVATVSGDKVTFIGVD